MTSKRVQLFLVLTWVALAKNAVAAPSPAASIKKPIVAVFEIASRNAGVSKASLEALTTFLSARVAATGLYLVSPQEAVRDRLKAQKKESYRLCYDRSCQIEIGRELAADHAFVAEIAKVGRRCLLSVKLYNLKDETTAFAHAEPLACDEGALGATLIKAVVALKRWREKQVGPLSSPAKTSAPATGPKVSVHIRSRPTAEVLIDDLRRGRTPLWLNLDPRKRHKLDLVREGYQTHHLEIRPQEMRRLDVKMRPTTSGRYDVTASSEWFVFEVGASSIRGLSNVAFAGSLSMVRIKWRHVFWTMVELNLSTASSSKETSGQQQGSRSIFMVGTRLGYPLYLGARGQHQLLLGLAAGYLSYDDNSAPAGSTADATRYLSLSPSVSYLYNALGGVVPIGFSLRGLLPVAGSPGAGEERPFGLMLTASLGINVWRALKGLVSSAKDLHQWETKQKKKWQILK